MKERSHLMLPEEAHQIGVRLPPLMMKGDSEGGTRNLQSFLSALRDFSRRSAWIEFRSRKAQSVQLIHMYENLEKKILDTNIRMKNSRRKYWMPIFGWKPQKSILDINIRMKTSRRKYWTPIFGWKPKKKILDTNIRIKNSNVNIVHQY